MSKTLSGAAGGQWFQVWVVAYPTNQNIRRIKNWKKRQLPNAKQARNACRGWWQLLRRL